MAEEIKVAQDLSRESKYEELIPQLRSLIAGEPDLTANMANVAAALKEVFGFFWVGFYVVKNGQLVLAPFQGPVACTRIDFGKGVCGAAWKEGRTIMVPDVDDFPGHIACSPLSRSEIVVPIFAGEEVIGVLDIDSSRRDDFDKIDALYLKKIAAILKI
ncbi:MAG: GAF domain-containing protein [Dysgonamonadaceae bacterium]|jgi:GAF domain-containing protein|nr:GAF domain-containing protein [Dysgonamonadaceae bacterium]